MSFNKNFITITFLSLLFFASCTSSNQDDKVQEALDGEEIRYLDADDENVRIAYENAQRELAGMESYFLNDSLGSYQIYVKAKFMENEVGEHMWGSMLSINQDSYTIRLDNEPFNVHNVAYGDTLIIDKTEVEDFLVYEGEALLMGDFMNW